MQIKENMIAVLTGDLIKSSTLSHAERRRVIDVLQRLDIEKFDAGVGKINLHRGDSIQLKIHSVHNAMHLALYLKAVVKSMQFKEKERKPSLDMRISIGIGEIDFETGDSASSDGPAYRISGQNLDKMRSSKTSLQIISGDERWNEEWKVITSLLCEVIDSWSISSAELFVLLLEKDGEVDAEKDLGISDAALSQRKKHASWKPIKTMLEYYSNKMKGRDA